MADRTCQGCGVEITPSPRERRRRLWCTEACRLRRYRDTHSDYRAAQAEASARRHRETYVPVRHELTCPCGSTFTAKRPEAKYCSKSCKYRGQRATEAGQRAKRQAQMNRRARQHGAQTETFTREEIFKRDGWRCGICRKPVLRSKRWPHPKSPSLDHIVPLAAGGDHARSNVQCAHHLCNSLKQHNAAADQLRLIG